MCLFIIYIKNGNSGIYSRKVRLKRSKKKKKPQPKTSEQKSISHSHKCCTNPTKLQAIMFYTAARDPESFNCVILTSAQVFAIAKLRKERY